MLNVSEIATKTEEMFDLFNRHFYNGEMTLPAITVSPDGGRGEHEFERRGHCPQKYLANYRPWSDR